MPLFEITDEIRAIAIEGFSDLLLNIGKTCELHYPPTWVTDAAVVADPVGGKPASRWITGEAGSADPTYDYVGKRAVEVKEVVKMLIAWGPRDFYIKPGYGVQIPAGSIQTKGFLKDVTKILKCDYMLLQTELSGRFHLKYKRVGSPVDISNITPNVFFICDWERVA